MRHEPDAGCGHRRAARRGDPICVGPPRWHPVASDIALLLLGASLPNDALGVPMPPRALVTNARFRLRPSPGDPDSVIGVWDGHGIGEQDGNLSPASERGRHASRQLRRSGGRRRAWCGREFIARGEQTGRKTQRPSRANQRDRSPQARRKSAMAGTTTSGASSCGQWPTLGTVTMVVSGPRSALTAVPIRPTGSTGSTAPQITSLRSAATAGRPRWGRASQPPAVAAERKLVIWGAVDPVLPVGRIGTAVSADLGPDTTMVTVPSVGHWPHEEAPEVVVPAIADFLRA